MKGSPLELYKDAKEEKEGATYSGARTLHLINENENVTIFQRSPSAPLCATVYHFYWPAMVGYTLHGQTFCGMDVAKYNIINSPPPLWSKVTLSQDDLRLASILGLQENSYP